MMKNVKLMLKGISEESGAPFTKEIHTLDEVKSSGSYKVIGRNVSTENGLPAMAGKKYNCFCCEAQLAVTCCYSEDEAQSNTAYGQYLTISDRETGDTATYTRSIAPNKNDGKWSTWQMVATGDAEIVAASNDVNERISVVAATLRDEIGANELKLQTNLLEETTRAQTAETELDTRKADEDGYHPKMTAGFADNLVGRGEAVEAQFIYRPTGGTQSIEDGVARIERIKGNTIVWNQLAKVQESVTINGVTIESVGDGSYKVYTAEDTPTTGKTIFNVTDVLQAGRKYAVFGAPSGSTSDTYCLISSTRAESGTGSIIETTAADFISIFINENITINTPVIFHPQVFNLTQMFGAGNEPTREEFKALFPYAYGYNKGELKSLHATAIKSVGFNLLNLEGRSMVEFEKGTIRPNEERVISEKQIWNVISPNGYAGSYYEKYTNISIGDNAVIATGATSTESGYGLGFPIKVLPKVKYTINCSGIGIVGIGYYKSNGIFINHKHPISAYTFNFTTPADCYWAMIVFIADKTSLELNITNITLSITHSGYRDGEVEDYKEFTRELPMQEYFPDGMKSADNAYDELTSTKAIKRIGKRIYQAGDETNEKVMTDGVATVYVLESPEETAFAEPLNMDYEVSDFGTEEAVSEGSSAPFRADIVYGFNAVDSIRNNRTEIQALLKRIQLLEEKV